MLSGVSTSGTSSVTIQIGDSGGIETSSYLGSTAEFANADNPGVNSLSSGFLVRATHTAAAVLHGSLVLTNINSNTWVALGNFSRSDSSLAAFVAGTKALSGTLDRVRITTFGGSDTFDAGTVNIFYE